MGHFARRAPFIRLDVPVSRGRGNGVGEKVTPSPNTQDCRQAARARLGRKTGKLVTQTPYRNAGAIGMHLAFTIGRSLVRCGR